MTGWSPLCVCICARRQERVHCLVLAHSECGDHTLRAPYCKWCQQLGDKFIAGSTMRQRKNVSGYFQSGGIITVSCQSPLSPAPNAKNRLLLAFFQTSQTYAVGEVYKIFIPLLCKTCTKSHLNSGMDILYGWPMHLLFYSTLEARGDTKFVNCQCFALSFW